MGILTVIDRTALAGYCQSYARYVEAEQAVEKYGILLETDNGLLASPRVAVSQKYLQICKAFCVEFGMTPSARGRMTFGAGDEKEDDFEKTLD
jgi:P27 family predicted phage terminase small subunit